MMIRSPTVGSRSQMMSQSSVRLRDGDAPQPVTEGAAPGRGAAGICL